MAEHLLIYLIDEHKTREKAERELVQFLTSLKYYADRSWLKAKTYA